jgi:hypothetical protein
MTAIVAQALLRSGTTHRTCWIEPRCRPGDQITLRNAGEPDRRWDVLWMSAERRDVASLHRDWRNNI